MQNVPWQRPVATSVTAVSSAFEALDLLDHHWPNIKGPRFVKARYACLAALDGRESAEVARETFKDAVAEAQLN